MILDKQTHNRLMNMDKEKLVEIVEKQILMLIGMKQLLQDLDVIDKK